MVVSTTTVLRRGNGVNCAAVLLFLSGAEVSAPCYGSSSLDFLAMAVDPSTMLAAYRGRGVVSSWSTALKSIVRWYLRAVISALSVRLSTLVSLVLQGYKCLYHASFLL